MRPTHLLLIATIILMLLAVPAGAALTPYYNQAAWEAAVGSTLTTITFDGLATDSSPYWTSYPVGITQDGVTFYSTNGETGNLSAQGPLSYTGNRGTDDYLMGGWAPNAITATFTISTPMAVGFDLGSYATGKTVRVTFSSGGYIDVATSASWTFLGVISDTPLTSVSFSALVGGGGSNYTLLDDFSYGDAGGMEETPEASSALLGGLGLLALLAARRWRKPVSA